MADGAARIIVENQYYVALGYAIALPMIAAALAARLMRRRARRKR